MTIEHGLRKGGSIIHLEIRRFCILPSEQARFATFLRLRIFEFSLLKMHDRFENIHCLFFVFLFDLPWKSTLGICFYRLYVCKIIVHVSQSFELVPSRFGGLFIR